MSKQGKTEATAKATDHTDDDLTDNWDVSTIDEMTNPNTATPRDESGLLEDTQNDLANARNEMERILELTKELYPNNLSEERHSKLRIIHAYAENELYRLDRLEEDIKKLNNKV